MEERVGVRRSGGEASVGLERSLLLTRRGLPE